MIGRPSDFTPEIANEICERMSKGESLRRIVGPDRDDFMPSETTVRRWLAGAEDWSAEFRRQYAQARENQADFYAEDVVEISDEAVADAVEVARNRLRIDARKWYASKLSPKKYGDKVAHVGGEEGDAPIKTQGEVVLRFVRPGEA
jgi:hypothetical protein